MPVVPFGQPIDVAAWDRFAAATGLPVVIDAAAGFDTLVPGRIPTVVSLHATKVLGAGEGAFVTLRRPLVHPRHSYPRQLWFLRHARSAGPGAQCEVE